MIPTPCLAPARLQLLLVEDQGMMRSFLARWLLDYPRFSLAAAVRSGEEAIPLIDELRPDIALVDLQLPGMDGLEFIRTARQVRPQLRALLITTRTDVLALTRVRESGVEGYVEKEASLEILAQALNTVADGRTFYSNLLLTTLAREAAQPEGAAKILSRREQEVLNHVLQRLANREIAEIMGLGIRTVEFHRANVMTKLEASNLTELQTEARRRGWKT